MTFAGIFYGTADRVFQPDGGKAVSLWERG